MTVETINLAGGVNLPGADTLFAAFTKTINNFGTIDGRVNNIEGGWPVVAGLDGTGAADIATPLYNAIKANINAATGISVVRLPTGTFLCHLDITTTKVAELLGLGCKGVVIKGAGQRATRLRHNNTAACIRLDMTGRASASQAVSAISLQIYQSADYLHRLTLPTAFVSTLAKHDILNIQSQNRPEFDATGRWVAENFRVKDIDTTNGYVWVDGRLEFASLYTTSPVCRKLSKELSLTVEDVGLRANGDPDTSTVSVREHMVHCVAASDVTLERCLFESPWAHAVRWETCSDSFVRNCDFRYGINRPTTFDQLTYGLQAYAACYNVFMIGCTEIGYRHFFTTDGASSRSTYVAASWYEYGQPSFVGARDCQSTDSKGAPFDTHEEGANVWFVNCSSNNNHSSDESGAFTGAAIQIRCRRVHVVGGVFTGSNYAVSVKPYEHGVDNWIRIKGISVHGGHYNADNSRGLYVSTGQAAALTNPPRIYLEDTTFTEVGTSISLTRECRVEGQNVRSLRPHRGHGVVGHASAKLTVAGLYLDSDSANLTGAATANRTLFGLQMTGASECHVLGLTHRLGTDTAKHPPALFDATDTVTGKKVSLTNYAEVDPSGIGRRATMTAGEETYFDWQEIDATVRLPKARLPAAGRQGRSAFVTDEVGGAMPAWDNGTAWKRYSDGATVA